MWAVGEHIYQNPNPPPNFLDSSLIIHFDGTMWREIPIEKGRQLSCVWGSNPSDIWFGGAWGALYHFNGTECTKVPFDTTTSFIFMTGFSPSNIFTTCVRELDFVPPEDSSFYLLYNYAGTSWITIDSFMITPDHYTRKFGLSLWASPQGNLYSATYGVYRYLANNNMWEQLLQSDWPIRVQGSDEQNVFAVGGIGLAYHWNGLNWIQLQANQLQYMIFYDAWTNNKETFIVSNNGRQTYIIHGQ